MSRSKADAKALVSGELKKIKSGRPKEIIYTPELGTKIASLIATNPLSIGEICKKYPEIPGRDTIYQFIYFHKDFADKYAEARKHQSHLMTEFITEIADDSTDDYRYDEAGKKVANPEHIARKRLMVDTRKWIASKIIPKVYGDGKLLEEVTVQNDELKKQLAELRAQLDAQNKKDY